MEGKDKRSTSAVAQDVERGVAVRTGRPDLELSRHRWGARLQGVPHPGPSSRHTSLKVRYVIGYLTASGVRRCADCFSHGLDLRVKLWLEVASLPLR